jgi:hypothetical protein
LKKVKTLKQIIEQLETKILVRYRFAKGTKERKTNCRHCRFYNEINNSCKILNDTINPIYVCDEFKKTNKDTLK